MEIDGPDTLNPWQGEKEWHHRALLLWAMQSADLEARAVLGRPCGPVARAVQRPVRSVKRLRLLKRWAARLIGHADTGEDPQQFAARYYRAQYLPKYGRTELPEMATVVTETLLRIARGAKTPLPGTTAAQEAAKELLGGLVPPDADVSASELQEVQDAVDAQRRRQLDLNRQYTEALTRLVSEWGKQVESGDLKLTRLSDVTAAYDLLQRLQEERATLEGTRVDSEQGAAPVQETARVRIAKARGESVAAAVHADLQELLVVSDQLQAMEEQQAIELALVEGEQEAG